MSAPDASSSQNQAFRALKGHHNDAPAPASANARKRTPQKLGPRKSGAHAQQAPVDALATKVTSHGDAESDEQAATNRSKNFSQHQTASQSTTPAINPNINPDPGANSRASSKSRSRHRHRSRGRPRSQKQSQSSSHQHNDIPPVPPPPAPQSETTTQTQPTTRSPSHAPSSDFPETSSAATSVPPSVIARGGRRNRQRPQQQNEYQDRHQPRHDSRASSSSSNITKLSYKFADATITSPPQQQPHLRTQGQGEGKLSEWIDEDTDSAPDVVKQLGQFSDGDGQIDSSSTQAPASGDADAAPRRRGGGRMRQRWGRGSNGGSGTNGRFGGAERRLGMPHTVDEADGRKDNNKGPASSAQWIVDEMDTANQDQDPVHGSTSAQLVEDEEGNDGGETATTTTTTGTRRSRRRKRGGRQDQMRPHGEQKGDVRGKDKGKGKEKEAEPRPLKLRLELDLDLELELKARIKGDVTIAVLG